MSDLNIKLKKENIISLVNSFYDIKNEYIAYDGIMNFLIDIRFWTNYDLIDLDKTIRKQITNKEEIIERINTIKKPVILENYDLKKFQSIDSNILLNFSEKKENTLCILETLRTMVKEEEISIVFVNMYLELINKNLITPVKNKQDIKLFNQIIYEILSSENVMEEKNIKLMREKALYIIFDKNFDIETKKEAFCHYIEKTEFDFDNSKLKNIYECLKKEDFTNYYKNYTTIRNFYNNSEKESIIENLYTTTIQFNVLKNSENYKLKPDDYNKFLKKGHYFALEKSKTVLDIENIIEIFTPSIFKVYINSYKNNEETQLFVKKYEKFLELVPEITTLPIALFEKDLEEQWNNISLFVEINNKSPKKLLVGKKKI